MLLRQGCGAFIIPYGTLDQPHYYVLWQTAARAHGGGGAGTCSSILIPIGVLAVRAAVPQP
jgi:hypothetical protein